VGAGWSVSNTGAEFTKLLWGKLLWSLVILGSESLELLTSSWHSGEEGIIECRRILWHCRYMCCCYSYAQSFEHRLPR
jgi:hypothetical protein